MDTTTTTSPLLNLSNPFVKDEWDCDNAARLARMGLSRHSAAARRMRLNDMLDARED